MIEDKYYSKCLSYYKKANLALRVRKLELPAILGGILAVIFSIEVSKVVILVEFWMKYW